MPLLQLALTGSQPDATELQRLHTGLTRLMADVLGKRADLTVVQVVAQAAARWACNGQALNDTGWCASLVVFVTDGSNTRPELAAFIVAADALLRQGRQQPPAAPVYTIIHNVDGAVWGYDGMTQLARRTPAAA